MFVNQSDNDLSVPGDILIFVARREKKKTCQRQYSDIQYGHVPCFITTGCYEAGREAEQQTNCLYS